MRNSVVALTAAVLIAGCVSVNKSVLSQSRAAQPVPREDVYVYLPGDSVPPHERIAILTANGDVHSTDQSQMIDKMRQEAGKLGANAIILGDVKDPNTASLVLGAIFGTSANRTGQAIAIYVPDLRK